MCKVIIGLLKAVMLIMTMDRCLANVAMRECKDIAIVSSLQCLMQSEDLSIIASAQSCECVSNSRVAHSSYFESQKADFSEWYRLQKEA